jgi:hypothetical protein
VLAAMAASWSRSARVRAPRTGRILAALPLVVCFRPVSELTQWATGRLASTSCWVTLADMVVVWHSWSTAELAVSALTTSAACSSGISASASARVMIESNGTECLLGTE